MDGGRYKTVKVNILDTGSIRHAETDEILGHLSADKEFDEIRPGQPEPEFGAYVLKRRKDGTPTKVQIRDKEYALIPPPIGKGKGRK